MKPNLVLDTNIVLLDANNILTLGQDNIIILPETVIDEMDVKKTDKDPNLRYQARSFGRLMTAAEIVNVDITAERAIITRQHGDVIIKTISLSDYGNITDVEPSIRNDRKILTATKYLLDNGVDLTFMANDTMCRERAIIMGIPTIDFKFVELNNDEFTKHISINSYETFAKLHNLPIFEVNPEHQPFNYNYIFSCPEYTSQVKLGNVRNGLIDILGKDTEAELTRQDVTPMNAGQKFLSRAIQNPNIDIVVCEALAGSGKTVTAFSNAIRLVKKGEYSGIIYIRASVDDVDKAEEVGFLSGNDEKMAVYLHPVDDTLEFIARNRNKSSKLKGKEYEEMIQSNVEDMKTRYNIRAMTTLGLRGRTFNSKDIIILDEFQNQSKSSGQKTITRFGKDCKLIIIGSNRQIDNPYETKYTNALSVVLDACGKEHPNVRLYAGSLDKVLRSPIAEFAEHIFSKAK